MAGDGEERGGRTRRLDILFNNAGTTRAEPIADVTLETWRRIMAVNADGVFLGTRTAIPAMRQSGGGSIINMSSVLGVVGTAHLAAYTASKGAVRYFTKCVALECARDGSGIRVNSIHPAFIHTPMMDETATRMFGDAAAGPEEFGKLHPVGHVGEPTMSPTAWSIWPRTRRSSSPAPSW